MIGLSNIKIFDKIYELKYEENKSQSEFINSNFSNNTKNYIDFVNDNKDLFTNVSLLITQDLGGYGIVSNTFPELNNNGLNKYYEYKKKQFKDNDKITLNYEFNDFPNLINIHNNKALKLLIDYFIDNNLIKAKGDYATMNILGMYDLDFSKLSVNKVSKFANNENDTNSENNVTINVYGDKNKINKNDFSHKKKELEKKSWFETIIDNVFGFLKHKK